MKKIFTLAFGVAVALSSNAQTIFSTALNSQEEFDAWTVVDANEDGSTWNFSASNDSGKRTYYTYHSTNQANDWMISPAITATEAGNYLVAYSFECGTSYAEAMNVAYASTADVSALSANIKNQYPEIRGANSDFFFVSLEAGQTIYLGFQAVSQPDMFRLYLQNIEVRKCENPVDLTITGLVSPESAEGLTNAEQLTVEIGNYGLVPAEAGSYSVTVNIDGTEAFTETINQEIGVNETAQVTLSTPVDLSVSHHTYKLTLTVNNADDVSTANNTLTTTVRHIGPAVEPYTMGFESDEDTSDIKFFNLNNDSGYWSRQASSWFVNPARTGVYAMCYNYNIDNEADDWAILDGIQMAAGYHALKFWVSTMDDTHQEAFSVAWGTEANPDAMVNPIATYDPITSGAYVQKICIFELTEPATVYIGFHATSPANQNWIAIDDIEVNSISASDVEIDVKDLTNPVAYLPNWESKNVSFNVMNQGIVDVDATLSVKIDGNSVYSENVTLVAQEDKTFTLPNLLDNLAEGQHTITVNAYNPNETNTDNNTISFDFRTLGNTELFWDFEDAQVPDNFTIRREEYTSLSESAIAEFGEQGVGILNIEQHEKYGSHMLGISTWLSDATSSADAYVVLPQVHVDSEDACIVFNAGLPSMFGSEKYRVRVSDEGDVWYDYTSVLTVNSETSERHTRGADLGEYVGKDVYVAFNATTTDGDCLALDNIGLYGCSLVTSGVKSVATEPAASNLMLHNGNLISNNGEIQIYDSLGRLVANVKANSFSVANLASGIYIARSGNSTLKFAR
jgi:hypothetical protein